MAITRVTLDKDNPVEGYEQGVDRNTDAGDLRGLYLQNDTSNDTNVLVSRDASDNMTLQDGVVTTPVTLSDVAIMTRAILTIEGGIVYTGDADFVLKAAP